MQIMVDVSIANHRPASQRRQTQESITPSSVLHLQFRKYKQGFAPMQQALAMRVHYAGSLKNHGELWVVVFRGEAQVSCPQRLRCRKLQR
jgi:hypothetical protein